LVATAADPGLEPESIGLTSTGIAWVPGLSWAGRAEAVCWGCVAVAAGRLAAEVADDAAAGEGLVAGAAVAGRVAGA
jgi:hypothetical protein